MIEKNHQTKDSGQTKWSILDTLHQYYVLTGDYESRDGVCHYKVFRDGLLEDLAITDSKIYRQGIYRQNREEKAIHWDALGQTEQMLRFVNQQTEMGEVESIPSQTQSEEARDGVCLECHLLYNEGSLLL